MLFSSKKNKIRLLSTVGNFAAFGILLFTLLYPVAQHNTAFFGYDTGFYRHYVQQPQDTFPRSPELLLGNDAIGTRTFLDGLQLITRSPDLTLFGGYVLLFIFIAILLQRHGKHLLGHWSFLPPLLFATSLTQIEAYQFFFWKQALALPLLLTTYLLLHKRSLWALLPALLVLVTHRTTGIVLLLTTAPLFWFLFPSWRKWFAVSGIFIATLFAWWQQDVFFLLWRAWVYGTEAPDFFALRHGHFITGSTYIWWALPLLPLALWGLVEQRKQLLTNGFFWLGLVSLCFAVFRLPFHNRLFVFFDMSVIMFAAIGTATLFAYYQATWRRIALVLLTVAISATWLNALFQKQPGIDRIELSRIAQVQSLPREVLIMTLSSRHAPWLYGWGGRTVIAPGLFHDKWLLFEWISFWSNVSINEQIALLNVYKEPLYLFLFEKQTLPQPLGERCFEQVTESIYRYICRF